MQFTGMKYENSSELSDRMKQHGDKEKGDKERGDKERGDKETRGLGDRERA